MVKFLMAIMLLATGIKCFSSCDAFNNNRYDFAELTLQSEENEKEKGDQEKSNNEDEDEVFLHSFVTSSSVSPTASLQISWEKDAYRGFVISPAIPPPDAV